MIMYFNYSIVNDNKNKNNPLTRNATRRATVTRRLLRSCKGWANTTRYLKQREKNSSISSFLFSFFPPPRRRKFSEMEKLPSSKLHVYRAASN